MLVAEIAVFLKALGDDAFEFWREIGIQAHRRGGSCVENGLEDDARAFTAEGKSACRHLVEDGAEREQVSASVEFLGADLLGRHIGDGADGGPGTREVIFK